jgi:hypothetical protein
MLLLWIKVDSFIPIILPNLNPICHLLALRAQHILHVGRIRVKGAFAKLQKETNNSSCLFVRLPVRKTRFSPEGFS